MRNFYQRANELVGMKIHPTSIISGYRLAQKEAVKYINERLSVKVRISESCLGKLRKMLTVFSHRRTSWGERFW